MDSTRIELEQGHHVEIEVFTPPDDGGPCQMMVARVS